MFFKSALIALCSSFALVGIADAQVESEGMADLDAWGTRLQEAGAREFPSTLWTGSDAEALLARLEAVRTDALTASERLLLRRVLLSPARRPTGAKADELLAQRTRLLVELGEADAAAALAPRLETVPGALDGEAIGVDLDLARGNEASACGTLDGTVPDGLFWLKLRAVCAVLRGNYSGAELAVELASVRGMDDPWFVSAIFAASGDSPEPPPAKFDSGLNIALSATAELDTSAITLSGSRPDLTAITAQRPDLPLELRARLARMASEAELLEVADWRKILFERLDKEDSVPEGAIEETLAVLDDLGASTGQKAEKLAETLSIAAEEPLPVYASLARLFAADLDTLPNSEMTSPYALIFAKAALVAGNVDLARRWIETVDFASVAAPSSFEVAELEAMEMVLRGDASASRQLGVQKRLIASLLTNEDEAAARTLLSAWTGLGLGLGHEARAFLLTAEPSEPTIEPNTLLAVRAAAQAGAIGEAALMILAETAGNPGALSEPDLASVLDILVDLGAEDIAASLAIEASQIWQN